MNKNVHDFVELIERNKGINTKEEMISIVTQTIAMVRDGRAVFHTNFFAVVFCYSKNSSFSNVVLSLSKLEKYDHIPCFVVLVRKNLDNVIYMIISAIWYRRSGRMVPPVSRCRIFHSGDVVPHQISFFDILVHQRV